MILQPLVYILQCSSDTTFVFIKQEKKLEFRMQRTWKAI